MGPRIRRYSPDLRFVRAIVRASGVDGFGPVVEVVRAEIAIELTADQHVVDAGQDRGDERAERLFGAAAGAQAVELGLEIAGLLPGGGRGALHQGPNRAKSVRSFCSGNRENASTISWLAHVFTRPGPFPDIQPSV